MLIFLLVSSNFVSTMYYVYDITIYSGWYHRKPVYPQCQVSRYAYARNCVFLPLQIYHFQGCIMLRMKLKYSQILRYCLHQVQHSVYYNSSNDDKNIGVNTRTRTDIRRQLLMCYHNKWYLKINCVIEFIVWIWKCDLQGSG